MYLKQKIGILEAERNRLEGLETLEWSEKSFFDYLNDFVAASRKKLSTEEKNFSSLVSHFKKERSIQDTPIGERNVIKSKQQILDFQFMQTVRYIEGGAQR